MLTFHGVAKTSGAFTTRQLTGKAALCSAVASRPRVERLQGYKPPSFSRKYCVRSGYFFSV